MVVAVLADPCPFCEIIACRTVVNDLVHHHGAVTFTPLRPATRGHTLVVPVDHVEGIRDVPRELWSLTMVVALEVAHRLYRELEPDGMNIIQSTGVSATQSVAHLHIHVVPRYPGDNMGPIWP